MHSNPPHLNQFHDPDDTGEWSTPIPIRSQANPAYPPTWAPGASAFVLTSLAIGVLLILALIGWHLFPQGVGVADWTK